MINIFFSIWITFYLVFFIPALIMACLVSLIFCVGLINSLARNTKRDHANYAMLFAEKVAKQIVKPCEITGQHNGVVLLAFYVFSVYVLILFASSGLFLQCP